MTGLRQAPVIDQDVTSWEFGQDPYPAMREWAELGPVVYNQRHDEYLVTGYRNCARTLASPQQFSSEDLAEFFTRMFGGITMEAVDDERHHAIRAIWAQFFQREQLRSQEGLVRSVVDPAVHSFVERVRSGEVVDAAPGMTRAIPTLVIARMLGVEESMHEQFSDWSDAIGDIQHAGYDDSDEGRRRVQAGLAATAALNSYVEEVLARRRAEGPGDDLVSMMVFHENAALMSEQEKVASITQLVFAGNETTAKLMVKILVALAQHPDQLRALAADRSLVPQAVEEVHRWETLVQTMPRRAASDDAAVAGVRVPRGAHVRVVLAAANRDPDRWRHPERLDVLREPRQHLGFGFGMHACLGLNLARLEIHTWLNRVLDELPEFHLGAEVSYGHGLSMRVPTSAPIAV